MTKDSGVEGIPHPISAAELAWARGHLTQLRHAVAGQRIILRSLGIGFVLGLAAHIGGYALKTSATMEPYKLIADLLYALGWALWTGVVVALFVEVIPKAKQSQIVRAIDAYEAALHEKAQANSTRTSRGDA